MPQSFDISRLSPAERILLAEELWDSLAVSPHEVPVPEEHLQELNRRLDAERRGELTSLSWEETKKMLFDRK